MSNSNFAFRGSMVAIVTPFRDGRVDYAALDTIVERQIEGGQKAILPCGSTGESATLSHEEHAEVERRRSSRGTAKRDAQSSRFQIRKKGLQVNRLPPHLSLKRRDACSRSPTPAG